MSELVNRPIALTPSTKRKALIFLGSGTFELKGNPIWRQLG
jgi:hypothetical protein